MRRSEVATKKDIKAKFDVVICEVRKHNAIVTIPQFWGSLKSWGIPKSPWLFQYYCQILDRNKLHWAVRNWIL